VTGVSDTRGGARVGRVQFVANRDGWLRCLAIGMPGVQNGAQRPGAWRFVALCTPEAGASGVTGAGAVSPVMTRPSPANSPGPGIWASNDDPDDGGRRRQQGDHRGGGSPGLAVDESPVGREPPRAPDQATRASATSEAAEAAEAAEAEAPSAIGAAARVPAAAPATSGRAGRSRNAPATAADSDSPAITIHP
jgi:hypothetical protein